MWFTQVFAIIQSFHNLDLSVKPTKIFLHPGKLWENSETCKKTQKKQLFGPPIKVKQNLAPKYFSFLY